MATKDGPPQTTTSEQTAVRVRLLGRDRLARLVVVGSFLTLFLLVGVLIVPAAGTNQTLSEAASDAFNAILPVLAGWVGTVLAFYFSAASQEVTSASLDRAISRGSAGSGTLVSEKMIPYSSIFRLRDLKVKGPEAISIEELKQDFKRKLPNGVTLSRLLFVEGGVFKYVLHVGTLNAFIVKSTPGAPQVTSAEGAAEAGSPAPAESSAPADSSPPAESPPPTEGPPRTLADILKDQDVLNQISKLVVFVSAGTTLGDAKTALDSVGGAQDIIVTGSGNATEPMLGWLSNVDLIKALEVK